MARRIAVFALPLLLVLGFFLLRSGLDSGDEQNGASLSGAQALSPDVGAAATDAEADGPELPEAAAGARRLAETEARTATGAEFDRNRAVWIEGRVAFPAGTPPDETLAVVAIAREGGEDRGRSEGPPWWKERVEDEASWSRSEIEPDGSFRAPLPEGTQGAELLLDGRHLYLAEALPVALGDGEPVVLEPVLGACLLVRCSPPPAAENGAAQLVGTEIELAGTPGGGGLFGMMGGGGLRRELTLEEELVAEFRGLPAEYTWYLGAEPDTFDATRVLDLELQAGATLERAVVFDLGALLAGVVVDTKGDPVEGADVSIDFSSQFARFAGGSSRTAETDTAGRFELRGVHPRKLKVRARKQGWIGSATDELDPREGAELRGIRLTLDRGQTIAGTLRFPGGDPAEGARVTLTPIEGGTPAFGRGRSSSGESDADGRFAVSGLDAGAAYDVVAVALDSSQPGDGEPVSAELEAAPEELFEGGGTRIGSISLEDAPRRSGWRARAPAVPAGTRGLELVLVEPPGLKGRVVGPDGAPVSSFEVTASVKESELGRGGRVQRKIDDPEGRFLLADVFAGQWVVEVAAEDLVTAEPELPVTTPQGGAELRIDMIRASALSGTVLDPNGEPLAGANLRLSPGKGGGGGGMGGRRFMGFAPGGSSAESEEGGLYTFTGLRPGEWTLRATHDDWAPSESTTVELLAGVETTDLVVSLGMGGTITGEIFGESGAPEAGRSIMAMSMGSGSQGSATSDAAGRFRMEHLAPGQYTVMAQPDLSMLSEMEERDEDPDPADFMANMKMASADVAEATETHVVLGAPPKDPVRLHGTVTEGGEPVTSGTVMVVAEGRSLLEAWKPVRVRENGTYEVTLDEPGNLLITYQDRTFESNSIEFYERVPEVDEHRFDIELPTGRIEGRVVGPDGGPLADVRVGIQRETGLRGITMMGGQRGETTDDDGRFVLGRLQAGSYTLRAGGGVFGGERYGSAVVSGVEVEAGGLTGGLRIQLERPGTLIGQVLDGAGEPVDGANVFVRDAQGRLLSQFSMTATDGEGRFRRGGLAPGEVTVSARLGEEASDELGPVRIREDDETEVELRLEPGTLLRVAVEDEEGAPIRVSVSVRDESGREYATLSSFSDMQAMMSEGFSTTEQRVGPLPPGTYEVTATTAEGESKSRTLKLTGKSERKLRLRIRD